MEKKLLKMIIVTIIFMVIGITSYNYFRSVTSHNPELIHAILYWAFLFGMNGIFRYVVQWIDDSN